MYQPGRLQAREELLPDELAMLRLRFSPEAPGDWSSELILTADVLFETTEGSSFGAAEIPPYGYASELDDEDDEGGG